MTENEIIKSRFFIGGYEENDIEGTTFEGRQYKGDYWNGWSTPFFTKEEGMRLCRFHNQFSETTNDHWGFDEVKDAFFYVSYHEEFPQITEFHKIEVKGEPFYIIGECFCWEEVTKGGRTMKKLSEREITDLAHQAVEEAVGYIQKTIGQDYGDVGGIFFSDTETTIDPMIKTLEEYIRTEMLYAEEEDNEEV